MPKGISERLINVHLQVRKDPQHNNSWLVKPTLIAHPEARIKTSKNIIFVVDTSSSMREHNRLPLVKNAINNIIHQLDETDRVSVIAFSTAASVVINKFEATGPNKDIAKKAVNGMKADGNTNFLAAFQEISNKKLINSVDNSTIIFLTDGDNSHPLTPSQLAQVVTQRKQLPRIVALGINLQKHSPGYQFIDNLGKLPGNRGKAIFIANENEEVFNQAFQDAYNLAREQSTTPTTLELTIEAKDTRNHTHVEIKRQLTHVQYDGQSECTEEFRFNSPTPPQVCEFRFDCDGINVRGQRNFTEQERAAITTDTPPIRIDNVKWKDKRISRWLLSLTEVGLGMALLVGSIFLFTMLTYPFWITLAISISAAVIGLGLFTQGTYGIMRKTCLLPSIQEYPEDSYVNGSYRKLPTSFLQPDSGMVQKQQASGQASNGSTLYSSPLTKSQPQKCAQSSAQLYTPPGRPTTYSFK